MRNLQKHVEIPAQYKIKDEIKEDEFPQLERDMKAREYEMELKAKALARTEYDLSRVRLQNKVAHLRTNGVSYNDIARILKITPSDARTLQQEFMEIQVMAHQEDAEEMRALENYRYDLMTQAVMPKALRGDTNAIKVAVQISQARRQMNNLDLQQSPIGNPVEQQNNFNILQAVFGNADSREAITAIISKVAQLPPGSDGIETE